MKKIVGILLMLISLISFTKDYNEYSTDILVSPKVAKEMISSNKDIAVLDIRKKPAFEKGHIKGSFQIWRPNFSANKGEYEYNGMRASKEKLEATLSSFGITSDTTIMLLSGKANYDASRLWWILDMYGHKDIHMIDGGIDGWRQANYPLIEGSSPQVDASNYIFTNEIDTSKLATLEDVKSSLTNYNKAIIDTRSDLEHDGIALYSGAFTRGRIPSEYYIEWDNMVNKDRSFKSPSEIKAILLENGIKEGMDIIAYCQSGVRSAHMTFVLSELLGYENVKNYDGSWIEWSYSASKGDVEVEKDNVFKLIFKYIKSREKMESLILTLGVWGPLAYIIIYALVTITCISVLPVTLVGGLVFGGIMGTVYTAIGACFGLSLSFLIARYIARKPIERKFGDSEIFKKIDRGVKTEGWFILATTRLLPIFPFGIQNYVYGLTSISFIQYSVLSIIFMMPGTVVFVLLAGAVASGDKATAIKMSLTASLIFFALTLVTKLIAKKSQTSTKIDKA